MTPLPVWLSIPELARLCGDKHRNSVRRLLDAAGVPLTRSGRKLLVFTSTLRQRMPALVAAIEDRRLESSQGKAACDADLGPLSPVSPVSHHGDTL